MLARYAGWGAVPLVVGLVAPHSDDVEMMLTTAAVAPRLLH